MKYFVTIGTGTHEVLVDGETVTVDGRTVRARLEDLPDGVTQLVMIGEEVHRVFARRGDAAGEFDLAIGGHRFQIEALDERARAIRDLSSASVKRAGPANLKAPMPGLIVRVNVAEGDTVRPGQGLVVMEAMKMENELRATAAGIVRKVHVTPGSAVEKGALLLEMETA
jgi:biotin carboxyl carrier protein